MPNSFQLKRTERNTFTVVLYKSGVQTDANRLDASGYTIRFFAKSSRRLLDADAEIRKDNAGIGGIVLQSGGTPPIANSEAIITVNPAEMVAMPNDYNVLEYVCQSVAPDSNVSAHDTGEIKIAPLAVNAT